MNPTLTLTTCVKLMLMVMSSVFGSDMAPLPSLRRQDKNKIIKIDIKDIKDINPIVGYHYFREEIGSKKGIFPRIL